MASKYFFARCAAKTARYTGSLTAFALACVAVAAWAVTGPLFGFSDSWQLVLNTATSIVTFLMVFLIQNTQDRDTRALQLKLDELLRATEGAHIRLIGLERLEEQELKVLQEKYLVLAREAHRQVKKGENDNGTPEVTLP